MSSGSVLGARSSPAAAAPNVPSANFGFLRAEHPMLVRLGALAELYALPDPNSATIKVRQFGELLAQQLAARAGVAAGPHDSHFDLLKRLELDGVLPREVAELLHEIRRAGNAAAHEYEGTPARAVSLLAMAREAGVWFHRTFTDAAFKPGPFVKPRPAADGGAELGAQVERLRGELVAARAAADAAGQSVTRAAEEKAKALAALEQRLAAAEGDQAAALSLAEEMERQLDGERARLTAELDALRAQARAAAPSARAETVARARTAASVLALDEDATRRLIDAQLRAVGWEADSEALRWAAGARPARGVNRAIAEVPTGSGPADYVLFAGLTPVAVVEAKRRRKNVPAALEQARRYAEDFELPSGAASPGGPWGRARVPFLFATNGRPYLRQLVDQSGIWFRDARREANHGRALEAWYSPEGLLDLLARDTEAADAVLAATPADYLPLRDYQHAAVRAVEQRLAAGDRAMLLAMATGTGKTRTLLGLVYRLLKAGRFRRVLFLVDRTALGEQALAAFQAVRVDGDKSLTDVYDVKALGDLRPDGDTRLHVTTVQGMVRRVLAPAEDEAPLPADAYDCVVVDECHRGYVLDRGVADAELGFRDEADYVSRYRRVLDHFDAVKVGLTATPALHTTEIFGAPVFQYTYRQAVVDGWLVDHEPPVRITTALSQGGMRWAEGSQVEVYHVARAQVELFTTPDELAFEVEDFNRRVVTEAFNRVVCEALARQIDPAQPGKTLVFAATDAHADMVVRLLTAAFEAQYGEVPDGTVVKITAAAEDPGGLLRRFRNEARPAVAVTVDLLTTGVDVPEIANLVFLRRVRSRILYEQMLGRATRPCTYADGTAKDVFRIYDAVDLYAALEPYTAMRPVVRSAAASIDRLVADLATAPTDETRRAVHEELVAALRRRRRRLERAADMLDAAANEAPPPGASPNALAPNAPPAGDRRSPVDRLIQRLRDMTPEAALAFLQARPTLVRVLDRHGLGDAELVISHHDDALRGVAQGWPDGQQPGDYLEAFGRYLREHLNEIPALLVVTQRPRDLTRADLLSLRLALDGAGFREAALHAAYRATNQDAAATIVGYVRQQALGDPLVPYAVRVERAVARVLARQPWTPPQRKWLEAIGRQMREEVVVDRAALDREQFRARGGFDRINKAFDGGLPQVLGDLQEAVWRESA